MSCERLPQLSDGFDERQTQAVGSFWYPEEELGMQTLHIPDDNERYVHGSINNVALHSLLLIIPQDSSMDSVRTESGEQDGSHITSHETEACLNPSIRKSTAAVQATMTQEQSRRSQDDYARLFGAGEAPDEQPTTTRRELWSYYLYYNGKHVFVCQRDC